MFLNKLSLIACAIAAITTVSSAQAATTVAQEKQQVFAVAKKYAEATACNISFESNSPAKERTTIKDVLLLKRDAETGSAKYYILWGGDTGCNGGSGTWWYMLSEVSRFSYDRPLLIGTANLFDQKSLYAIHSKFIESVKVISPTKMEVISSAEADKKYGGKYGGLNFPANKFKYTLSYDDYQNSWKISNQLFLERNKYK